jgi:phospholipid/cholesterol/gamma-HCH transport system substrate-binding protein
MSAKKRLFVGAFIIGGICLFGLGPFLIGSREQLFASHFHVYANFNSIDTLQSGATVRVSGMNAGQITAIQVPKNPSQGFRLTLQIDDKFRPIVRDDSVATIETSGMGWE